MSLIFLLFKGLNLIFGFFRPLALTGFIFGFGGFRNINFLPGCLLLEVWVCGGGCGQVRGVEVQVLVAACPVKRIVLCGLPVLDVRVLVEGVRLLAAAQGEGEG